MMELGTAVVKADPSLTDTEGAEVVPSVGLAGVLYAAANMPNP